MKSYLIIDDEASARSRLKRLLAEYSDLSFVGEAENGLQGLKSIHEKKPELVFLDIEMPGINGIELAKCLPLNGPQIIFVTAYDEFALEAFEAKSLDYIVKPINENRLRKTVEKIRNSSESTKPDLDSFPVEQLAFKVGTNFQVISLKEISLIQSENNYNNIYFEKQEVLTEDSLDHLMEKLPQKDFVRIHRSAIVNLGYLQGLKRLGDRKYLAILKDYWQHEVSISRDKLPMIKNRLGL